MPITATGILSGPLEATRQLLSVCPTWQAWVNATGDADARAAGAAERIYLVAPNGPADAEYSKSEQEVLRPFWVISPAGPWRSDRRGVGGPYIAQGTIKARLEVDAGNGSNRDEELDFLNKLGALIAEACGIDEGLGYLVPMSIDIATGPQRSSRKARGSEGDYFTVELAIGYEGLGA